MRIVLGVKCPPRSSAGHHLRVLRPSPGAVLQHADAASRSRPASAVVGERPAVDLSGGTRTRRRDRHALGAGPPAALETPLAQTTRPPATSTASRSGARPGGSGFEALADGDRRRRLRERRRGRGRSSGLSGHRRRLPALFAPGATPVTLRRRTRWNAAAGAVSAGVLRASSATGEVRAFPAGPHGAAQLHLLDKRYRGWRPDRRPGPVLGRRFRAVGHRRHATCSAPSNQVTTPDAVYVWNPPLTRSPAGGAGSIVLAVDNLPLPVESSTDFGSPDAFVPAMVRADWSRP